MGLVKGWDSFDADLVACPACQDQEEEARRLLRYAELPQGVTPRTFENFRPRPGVEEALAAAQQFAKRDGREHVLTLQGRFGCGKSHLLEAIGRAMLQQKVKVKYAFVPDLLDELRGAYDPEHSEGFEQVMARYYRAEALLLDDLGAEKPTEWAVEQLTKLVDRRYRNGELLAIATNLTPRQMERRLGGRLADRVFDINTGQVRVAHLEVGSYRGGESG